MEGSRTPVPRAEKSEDEEDKEEEEKWVNKDKRDEVMISREWMEGKTKRRQRRERRNSKK